MSEIIQKTRKADLNQALFHVTIMISWPSQSTVPLKILLDAKQNLRQPGWYSVLLGFGTVTKRSTSACLLFAEVFSHSSQETSNRMNPVTIETIFSVSRLSPLACTFRDVHTTLSVRLTQPQHEGGVLTAAVLIIYCKECLALTSSDPSGLSWLSPFVYPSRRSALSLL